MTAIETILASYGTVIATAGLVMFAIFRMAERKITDETKKLITGQIILYILLTGVYGMLLNLIIRSGRTGAESLGIRQLFFVLFVAAVVLLTVPTISRIRHSRKEQ